MSPLDPDRIDQIIAALGSLLRRRAIAQRLITLKRFTVEPEQIDEIVLAAIKTSLCVEDDRLLLTAPELSLEPASRDQAA